MSGVIGPPTVVPQHYIARLILIANTEEPAATPAATAAAAAAAAEAATTGGTPARSVGPLQCCCVAAVQTYSNPNPHPNPSPHPDPSPHPNPNPNPNPNPKPNPKPNQVQVIRNSASNPRLAELRTMYQDETDPGRAKMKNGILLRTPEPGDHSEKPNPYPALPPSPTPTPTVTPHPNPNQATRARGPSFGGGAGGRAPRAASATTISTAAAGRRMSIAAEELLARGRGLAPASLPLYVNAILSGHQVCDWCAFI